MKNMTYLTILIFVLFGCVTTDKHMNIEREPSDSLIAVIERAKVGIASHIKNNGIDPEGKELIYKAYGQIRIGHDDKRCKIFHDKIGFDELNEKVESNSDWVIAMILDEKGQYIARSSIGTLNKHPEQLNDYPREIRMIELAQKENYLTYIEMLNCNENYIIGYKKNGVDVYQYSENDLTLIYTK